MQPTQIRVIAEPKDGRQIDDLMRVVSERFASYPGMRAFSSRGSIISSNDGGTRSINIDVSGANLADIYRTAAAIADRAGRVFDGPQIRSDPTSLLLGQPLIELRPRWDRLAELGITASEFGFGVAALTDGALSTSSCSTTRRSTSISTARRQPRPRVWDRPASAVHRARCGRARQRRRRRERHRGHRHAAPGRRPAHGDGVRRSAEVGAAGSRFGARARRCSMR